MAYSPEIGFTPQEEVPRKPKPKLRLVPPDLPKPGQPRQPQEEAPAMSVPENIVLGAEYQPVDVQRKEGAVDIGQLLKEDEKAAQEAWFAQREADEKQKDELEKAIALIDDEDDAPTIKIAS